LRLLTTIAILLTWFLAAGQSPIGPRLEPYLAATPLPDVNVGSLDNFIEKLDRKHQSSKNEVQFLYHVFTRVHQSYFRKYHEHTTFANLLTDGSYNCLTGTILFSTLFDHFGIRHEIIETNYHIFIVAHTEQGDVLIETTDPVQGFVTSSKAIEDRLKRYSNNEIQPQDETLAYYRYSFNLFNTVNQNELVGLLYYNLAVDAFNRQLLEEATSFLAQAGERYLSPRIEEFSVILLLAVHEKAMAPDKKAQLKKMLQTIRYKALPVMASSF
jgi:hypothetical protein